MTFTLTFAWWWIPAAVTGIAILWAFLTDNSNDTFGIGAIFKLAAVGFVSTIAWAIGGFLK